MQISPGSPSGTSLPASSRIVTSVDGSGSPIVPLYSVAVTGLQVATGDVSDSP